MKILNSTTPKITLQMENDETTIYMVGGNKVKIIIVEEGAKK